MKTPNNRINSDRKKLRCAPLFAPGYAWRCTIEMKMTLTEKQIKKGFWYFDRAHQFPPECITYLDEYKGGDTLNIACTQLPVPAAEQRSIVKQWCKSLSSLSNVKFLWFSSRVSQEMFEAASGMSSLEGLYIKWSGIKSIASISAIPNLQFFHLGTRRDAVIYFSIEFYY